MEISWKKFTIGGKVIEARVTTYDKEDKALLKELYFSWNDLNGKLKKISTRGINLPETISENAYCIFNPECVRVVKLKNGKCSYDVLNTVTGSRIQIKASSIDEDLSSFGPRSEWDELFFLDFSRADGTFDSYRVNADLIYNHQVNLSQTFYDQQVEGRRPRFSIKKIALENGIKPTRYSLN